MKHVVLGTAGHIDHGKTTLIKALTGIETDTTQEEQKRGLTINLGFAYLDLPNQHRVGIVDVPGHEKFIKNMLAGAAGIDLVLLVIDVNEGIMPQTREHIAILTLLGLKDFIVVLTKAGQAEKELIELVKEDIQTQFKDTPIATAPMVETDAITGLGIQALKEMIAQQVEAIEEVHEDLPARLNVDRAFSVKGFGTVVTGTLIEGTIRVGDELTIFPSGETTKVRNIQIHEVDQPIAYAGNRTALNLTKVTVEEIGRGDVLSAAPLELSYMLDGKVVCLPESGQALELWDRVHIHIGTREVLARIVPLGVEQILPGETGFVQFRLEEQLAVRKGDRFIVRAYSPVVTIAGGEILDAHPIKHRRFNEDVIESLQIKESGALDALILDMMHNAKSNLLSLKEIAEQLGLEMDSVQDALLEMLEHQQVYKFGQFYMSGEVFTQLADQMQAVLETYHQTHSLRSGMPLEEFRSKFKQTAPKELSAIVQHLVQADILAVNSEYIRLSSFKVALSPAQAKVHNAMVAEMKAAKWAPPSERELIQEDKLRKAEYERMLGKELYKLDRYIAVYYELYNEALLKAYDHLKANGSMTLADFRTMLNTSRKYALLFLDDFDNRGITKRQEDVRILANPNADIQKYLLKGEG